jgi:hypothetical protein
VQLSTDVANVGMRRVAEHVGFVHEGDLRAFWPEDDGDHDYAMYGMTRTDYERAARAERDAAIEMPTDEDLDGDHERRKEVRRWT